MFDLLTTSLSAFAHEIPLEVFVVVASFIEEIIAPIPSFAIMTLSGSIAAVQGVTIAHLVVLAVLGAIGKLLGALVVYFISDKAEDVVIGRFGSFFGVTHEEVESFGARIDGGVRGYVMLTLLRAFPFFPSVVISVGAGILKVPIPVFMVSTFIGTIVRDGFYLYAGYVGLEILMTAVSMSARFETYIEIVIGALLCFFIARLWYKKSKRMKESSANGN